MVMAVLAQTLAQMEGVDWRLVSGWLIQAVLWAVSLFGVWVGMRVENQGERAALRTEMQKQYMKLSKQRSAELEALKEKFNRVDARNEELEQRVARQTVQIERGRNETDRLIESNQTLQNDVERQQREFTSEMESIQTLHKEQMVQLERRAERQAKQVTALQSKIADMVRQRAIDERKITTLRSMLTSLRAQVEALLLTNKDLRAALRDSTERASTLRNERDNLHAQLLRLEAKLQGTQDEVERLRELVNVLSERGKQDDAEKAVRLANGDGSDAADGGSGDGAGRGGDADGDNG